MDVALFDRLVALGEGFSGVDVTFRRKLPAEWPRRWRVRLITSKNERAEYRQIGYGETFDEAAMDLLLKIGGLIMHFSLEEVMALPEGGGFGIEERIIDGKTVRVPTLRPECAFYVDETTPMTWMDSNGTRWRLGRYLDGEWFKKRGR